MINGKTHEVWVCGVLWIWQGPVHDERCLHLGANVQKQEGRVSVVVHKHVAPVGPLHRQRELGAPPILGWRLSSPKRRQQHAMSDPA